MIDAQLPPSLQALAEREAELYRDKDFTANPDGYHIAPFVNAETTSDAFLAGARWQFEQSRAREAAMQCLNNTIIEQLQRAHAASDKLAQAKLDAATSALEFYAAALDAKHEGVIPERVINGGEFVPLGTLARDTLAEIKGGE